MLLKPLPRPISVSQDNFKQFLTTLGVKGKFVKETKLKLEEGLNSSLLGLLHCLQIQGNDVAIDSLNRINTFIQS